MREDRRLELYHQELLQAYDEPADSVQTVSREEALGRCKQRLPKDSAELLTMRYESALSFAEIAARIGRTVEAARQQLARVRLALRECIKRQLTSS